MPTAELTEVGLDSYRSPRSRVDIAHSWDAPLSPTEPATDCDTFLWEQDADQHLFQPAERSDVHQVLMGFGLQRKLIVGAAIAATLAVGVLAYVFWPAAGEKKATETAEASPAVQSEAVAPGQAAPRSPESSLSGPTTVAWPDLPPSGIIESVPPITATEPVRNSETRAVATTQDREIVFLQRPGVNIRSTPATNGSVIGTAPKGTRFKVSNHEGDWVQVEGDRLKGWINSQFLGPNNPR
jgi:Bacterial SH3 domain